LEALYNPGGFTRKRMNTYMKQTNIKQVHITSKVPHIDPLYRAPTGLKTDKNNNKIMKQEKGVHFSTIQPAREGGCFGRKVHQNRMEIYDIYTVCVILRLPAQEKRVSVTPFTHTITIPLIPYRPPPPFL
jgi:hypothetical protein